MKTFKDYWQPLSAHNKRLLVADSNIPFSYLSNIANGHRNAGRKTINKLLTARPKELSFNMFVPNEDQEAS